MVAAGGTPLNSVKTYLGRAIARYLQKETGTYVCFSTVSDDVLRRHLRPGDVVLVEGNSRISSAIKYLTHSTWSHAAFYVGGTTQGCDLIEADLQNGVRWVDLAHYAPFNLRICRPIGLQPADLDQLINFMTDSIGRTYDLKNVFDLARYLMPHFPVPHRWQRRMIALGSGDPTRAICSTLIAEAFQHVSYPILPLIEPHHDDAAVREILHIRHHSLFAPRDFDLSPYFRVVKPTIESGFDFKAVSWGVDSDTV